MVFFDATMDVWQSESKPIELTFTFCVRTHAGFRGRRGSGDPSGERSATFIFPK